MKIYSIVLFEIHFLIRIKTILFLSNKNSATKKNSIKFLISIALSIFCHYKCYAIDLNGRKKNIFQFNTFEFYFIVVVLFWFIRFENIGKQKNL